MDIPLVKAIFAEFKGAKIDTLTRKISQNNNDNTTESFFNDEPIYIEEDN